MDHFYCFLTALFLLSWTFNFTDATSEGEDFVLSCSGLKDVNVTVLEWSQLDLKKDLLMFSDGKVLEGYEAPEYRGRVELVDPQLNSGDLSVVLKKIRAEDAGKYKCYALYEDGQEVSETMDLVWSTTATVGQDLELSCFGLKYHTVDVLKWTYTDGDKHVLTFRNGKIQEGKVDPQFRGRVQLKDPQLQSSDHTAVLKEVTFEDSGKYECKAVYKDKQKISRTVFLSIVPEVNVYKEAKEGEDIVLPCTGLKDHKYHKVQTLSWTHPNKKKDVFKWELDRYNCTESTERVKLVDPQLHSGDLSLVLKKVTEEDSGTYTCEAGYEDGQDISENIHLTVSGPGWNFLINLLPLLVLGPFILIVYIRLRLCFNCRRSGDTVYILQTETISY